MSSDLFTLVYGDKLAEIEQERAAYAGKFAEMEQELAAHYQERVAMEAREHTWQHATQQMVERVIITRFPKAPVRLLGMVRELRQPQALQRLLENILTVDDLSALEQALTKAAAQS